MANRIRRGRMAADVIGSHFTQIFNAALRDKRLSWRARGVLAGLLTHSDGFGLNSNDLAKGGPHGPNCSRGEGRDAVRAALKELEELGYLSRARSQDDSTKRFGSSDYVVTDMPDGIFIGEMPRLEPAPDFQAVDVTAQSRRSEPVTDFQALESQATENQALARSPYKKNKEEDHSQKTPLNPPARRGETPKPRRPRRGKASTTDQRVRQGLTLAQKYLVLEQAGCTEEEQWQWGGRVPDDPTEQDAFIEMIRRAR